MTSDKLDTPRCDNVALTIGGHRFNAPVDGVYETGQLAAKEAAGTVDGLIALDIFAGRTVTLDFAGGRIILETPDSALQRMARGPSCRRASARTSQAARPPFTSTCRARSERSNLSSTAATAARSSSARPMRPRSASIRDKGPVRGKIDIGRGIAAEGMIFPAGITLDGNLGMPFPRIIW